MPDLQEVLRGERCAAAQAEQTELLDQDEELEELEDRLTMRFNEFSQARTGNGQTFKTGNRRESQLFDHIIRGVAVSVS